MFQIKLLYNVITNLLDDYKEQDTKIKSKIKTEALLNVCGKKYVFTYKMYALQIRQVFYKAHSPPTPNPEKRKPANHEMYNQPAKEVHIDFLIPCYLKHRYRTRRK